MDQLLAPLRQRFDALVATLSPRDRRLLMGMVFLWYFAMVGVVWWIASGRVDAARLEVADREQSVKNLMSAASGYAETADQVGKIEEALKNGGSQDLSVFMEKAAEKVGITASLQVRPKEERTEGDLIEKMYSVEMSRITLQNLVDFLHAIETEGYPMKIRSMKTKTVTASGTKVLNVSLEVASYRYAETPAGEAG